MCFSATASFIAGGTLTLLGVACFKKVETKSEIPMALIPLLFGLQQLAEGVLWYGLAHDDFQLQQAMAYIFTGFSRIIWPIYVPLAVLALERVAWRKKVLSLSAIIGTGCGIYLMYFMLIDGISAEAVGHHIVYVSAHVNPFITLIFYVLAACASCFFSSHRYVNIFGALSLTGFIAAYLVSEVAAFSVWCFFAALISFYIIYHLNSSEKKPHN